MGNEAIALGALASGVNLASGYPGTPSSEIIEFISKHNKKTGAYVEWSVNEKAAVEVAAGAAIAGSRAIVTMKQVGLNVASDPVMCLSYVGVKGGLVIVSADDPGPISSQTEQDTRVFGRFSKIPVLDPSNPLEAFQMVQDAFRLSEEFQTPVIVRPTTRVCHAYMSFDPGEIPTARTRGEFKKDSKRWVIFPRASYLNHKRIFERNEKTLPEIFSRYPLNAIEKNAASVLDGGAECEDKARGSDCFGLASGGISYAYAKEALEELKKEFPESPALKNLLIFKVATPYPFPEKLALDFLRRVQSVLVLEELDPVIERELIFTVGKNGLNVAIKGKFTGDAFEAGENSVYEIKKQIAKFLSLDLKEKKTETLPELPVRPPVLCAGCPHRASFYAVKIAMKNKKTAYCGDIGCYTLGNAAPLDMCDSCLCMGADVTMAQGFYHNETDRHCFSFIGDSTFFASGIPGAVNAVYNQARQVICLLDNSTTAMTGHQPHPGTGRTMMGDIVQKISAEKILCAIGVNPVITVDPFDLDEAVLAVKKADEAGGVSAVIFKSPCVPLAAKLGYKFSGAKTIQTEKCVSCKKCVNELGCPAISIDLGEKKPLIEKSLCSGCGLCQKVCPVGAILEEGAQK